MRRRGGFNLLCTHCKSRVCVVVAVRLLSYKCLCKSFFSVFLVNVLLSLLDDTQRAWSGYRSQLRKSIFFHIDFFWGGYRLICLCWWHLGNLWICFVQASSFIFTFFVIFPCHASSLTGHALFCHPQSSGSFILCRVCHPFVHKRLFLYSQERILRIGAPFGQMNSFIFNFPPLFEASMYSVFWLSQLNSANWRINMDRCREK